MQVTKHHLRYYLLQRRFPAAQHGSHKTGSHQAWNPQPCSLPNIVSQQKVEQSTPSYLSNGGPPSHGDKLKHS